MLLDMVWDYFVLVFDVEVSIEVNFELMWLEFFVMICVVGYMWVLFGMQLVVLRVLVILDWVYLLGWVVVVVIEVIVEGFIYVNFDLIYGILGEFDDDLVCLVDVVVQVGVDYVFVYVLVVEYGMVLVCWVWCGELVVFDDDVLVYCYELVDVWLLVVGFVWYEVFNWC